MQERIQSFIEHVTDLSSNPKFFHYKWFVKWHLRVVERLALELADHHPDADRDLIHVMVWLHDYAKILDWHNERSRKLLNAGRDKLIELGFESGFANRAADYVELMDKCAEVDINDAPIEVRILSTADGCSHLTGPFLYIFWHHETDKNFVGKSYEEMMALNLKKANFDWEHKIVLPEARVAFEPRYHHIQEICGQLPNSYFKKS
ncbi:MAG TPA: hypothetical protein VGS28_03520 [Candidatus Saccharimonadales bacterium]|nr:hypothetical protein [Candidatus Saccharimonadales bacterium]